MNTTYSFPSKLGKLFCNSYEILFYQSVVFYFQSVSSSMNNLRAQTLTQAQFLSKYQFCCFILCHITSYLSNGVDELAVKNRGTTAQWLKQLWSFPTFERQQGSSDSTSKLVILPLPLSPAPSPTPYVGLSLHLDSHYSLLIVH